jgi:hypothetical protein
VYLGFVVPRLLLFRLHPRRHIITVKDRRTKLIFCALSPSDIRFNSEVFVFGSKIQCNQGNVILNLLRTLLSTGAEPIFVYGLIGIPFICCVTIIC